MRYNYVVEMKLEKKKSDIVTKQYEETARDYVLLEKVSYVIS